jgi:hypothetical protein
MVLEREHFIHLLFYLLMIARPTRRTQTIR